MPQVPSPTPPAFSLCSQLPLSAGKRKREGSKDARVAVEALSFRPSSPSPRFPRISPCCCPARHGSDRISTRGRCQTGAARLGSARGHKGQVFKDPFEVITRKYNLSTSLLCTSSSWRAPCWEAALWYSAAFRAQCTCPPGLKVSSPPQKPSHIPPFPSSHHTLWARGLTLPSLPSPCHRPHPADPGGDTQHPSEDPSYPVPPSSRWSHQARDCIRLHRAISCDTGRPANCFHL